MKRTVLSRTTIVLAVFIIVISLAYYGAYYNKLAFPVKDYGCLLSGGARVVEGQLPYIDFFSYYSPGRYLLLGGWFKIFDISVECCQLFFVLLLTISNLLLFLVACKFLPKILALIPTIIHLIMPGPWWKVWFILSVLVGLLLILGYMDKPGKLRAFIVGFGCGIMMWIRQDTGCYLLLTLAILFVITYLRKNPLRNFIYCIFGGIASGSTFVIYYMLAGKSFFAFLKETLWTVYITRQAGADLVKLWVFPNTLFGIAGILFMLIFAFIIYKKRKDTVVFTSLCALLLVAGFCFLHMQFGNFKYYRFPQDEALMYIISIFVGMHMYRFTVNKVNKIPARVGSFLILVFIIFGFLYYSYFTIFATSRSGHFAYTGVLPYFKKNWQKLKVKRMGNAMMEKKKHLMFKDAIEAVDSVAGPNEDVFYGSNAFLAFLSGHPTPAKEDVVYFLFADKRVMQDFLKRVEEKPPKVIVLAKRDSRIAGRNPEENIIPFLEFVKNNYNFFKKTGRYYIFIKAEYSNRAETEKKLKTLFSKSVKEAKNYREETYL